jgi:hypothetical protein
MVSELEFFELRQKIHSNGGNVDDFAKAYREKSGSKATDESLKATLSNRATALRKGLIEKGMTEDQAKELIPRFPRSTNTAADRDAALTAIMEQAKPKRTRSKKSAE